MRTGILTAIISLTALLSMHPAADAQPAAAVSDALAAKLDEYIAILEKEPVTVKGEEAYRFYLTDDLERAEAFSSKMSKYGGKNTGCLCGYGNVTDTELLNAIYN